MGDFYQLAETSRQELTAALASGKLVKGPCFLCGTTENIHGHHIDYKYPMRIIWLCVGCHSSAHAQERRVMFHKGREMTLSKEAILEGLAARGKSELWLSKEVGLSRGRLKIYLNEGFVTSAAKIADVLGVEIDYILKDRGVNSSDILKDEV